MPEQEDILPSRLVGGLCARLFRGAIGWTFLACLLVGWTLLGIATLLASITPATQVAVAGVVLILSLAISYLYAQRRALTPARVAQLFDRTNRLPDLLATAFELENREQVTTMEFLALRNIRRQLALARPFQLPEYGVARLIPWFLVPILLLALGNWFAWKSPSAVPFLPRAAEVAQTLEKLASTAEEMAAKRDEPKPLNQLAEAARRIAEEIMRASRIQEIYTGLATLSDAAKDVAAQTAPLDPLQREALKDALAEKLALDRGEENLPSPAAPEPQTFQEMVSEAAQELGPQDLARSLQAAVMDASTLSPEQQRQLEDLLGQIARDGSRESAMQRLGQLGDPSPRPENEAANAFADDLEALRDALQRGESLDAVGGALAALLDQPPDQLVLQQSPGGSGDPLGIGGQPGSAVDQGPGSDPLGDTSPHGIDPAVALRLNSSSPDAERLTTLLRRAATDEQARREYEQRLQSFGPIEADAADRESLPPTRREWVRRYFEAIRPAR
ncbi:MAG: hypothetical protein SNJ52_01445 [Verrucomicrobiia bacterium]